MVPVANFRIALQKILEAEGGYVNDPDDLGGETYCGIARKYHPNWAGWVRVDEYKPSDKFPGILSKDQALKSWVGDFYREWYWTPIGLDAVESQELAEELLDMGVHLGVKRAVMFLQRGLNVLNRRGRLWPDLTVDGDAGTKTLHALYEYEKHEAPNFLRKTLLLQRGNYYIDRALKREKSEKYIRGWLRRLRLI